MSGVRWRSLLVWVALGAALGPFQASGQQRVGNYVSAAYDHGETFDFALSWLKVVGGHAQMTVAPVPNDPDRIRIHSVAQSNAFFSKIFPVHDEIESVVDHDTFSTVIFQKILREGHHSKNELTVVDRQKGVALRKGVETPIPKMVLDPLSTIFYLRKLDLSPGKVHNLTVIADGKVYTLEAVVNGRETVVTDAGRFSTVVVEPKMRHGGIFRDENNRLLIWYSDDERHLPVRIRSEIAAGSITASLRSYALSP
jgi:hypothetical protein